MSLVCLPYLTLPLSNRGCWHGLGWDGMSANMLVCAVTDVEEQKQMLADDTRHFSMIRMLHLADLITELNGSSFLPYP